MTRTAAMAWIFPGTLVISVASCAAPRPQPTVETAKVQADASADPADTQIAQDASAPEGPDGTDEEEGDGVGPDVLKGMALSGPEPTLKTLCPDCKVYKKIGVPKKGPYKSVMILTSTWPSPAPGDQINTSYHLAIRSSDGWFIMEYLGTSGTNCGGESLFSTSFVLKTLEMRDVLPGDPPEVLLTYEESADAIRDMKLVICGVGPSAKPSCIGPLTPARIDPAGAYKSWEDEVTFNPDGSIEFKRGQDPPVTFTMVFP
jgi:hypothetical protein